ncbi:Glutathione reductase [Aeromonas salmonicida]|nr:Glutathione reductase [Aeromonas salmonicida]
MFVKPASSPSGWLRQLRNPYHPTSAEEFVTMRQVQSKPATTAGFFMSVLQ